MTQKLTDFWEAFQRHLWRPSGPCCTTLGATSICLFVSVIQPSESVNEPIKRQFIIILRVRIGQAAIQPTFLQACITQEAIMFTCIGVCIIQAATPFGNSQRQHNSRRDSDDNMKFGFRKTSENTSGNCGSGLHGPRSSKTNKQILLLVRKARMA